MTNSGFTTLAGGPAELLARGVIRLFDDLGCSSLLEFPLRNRRRVDVIALDRGGRVTIVEVKSSAADYRGDRKWRDYLPYCDSFYFAVAEDFDRSLLPGDVGILVADRYTAAILRPSPEFTMNPARRRALVLRFARTAGKRLMRLDRPDYTKAR
ncbi:MAG: MmcB family DNA repair protein [Alphaproteobacteria bacterium]